MNEKRLLYECNVKYVMHVNDLQTLQALMQPVVESLVLLDRGIFALRSCSTAAVRIQPLFNPTISPRNLAIIVEKSVSDFC